MIAPVSKPLHWHLAFFIQVKLARGNKIEDLAVSACSELQEEQCQIWMDAVQSEPIPQAPFYFSGECSGDAPLVYPFGL